MTVQFRPRAGEASGENRAYSPNRDLAYCYAPAMRQAIRPLNQPEWTPETEHFCAVNGVTEEMITRVVAVLGDAHRYVLSEDVTRVVDALDKAGWFSLHPAARHLVLSRVGEVMIAGFFLAARDTSYIGEISPQFREIEEFILAAKQVQERAHGTLPEPEPAVDLAIKLAAEQAASKHLEQLNAAHRKEIERLHRDVQQLSVEKPLWTVIKQRFLDRFRGGRSGSTSTPTS